MVRGELIMKKAFTLIELLVVVLIIGILAAIALPQYEKAVLKSRFTQFKISARAISDAQERYWLANNEYPARFDELDIDIGGTPNETDSERTFDDGRICSISKSSAWVNCGSTKFPMSYQIHASRAYEAGRKRCLAGNGNLSSPENQLCKADTGASEPSSGSSEYKVWDYTN